MVFQVFIDDSGSEPQSPIFVLAGFIASHEKWATFSVDWQAELDKSPKLDYFKMNEAAALRGQFSREKGWSERKRDARVLSFASIARQHAAVRAEATMRHDHFERYVRGIPAIARRLAVDHPYVMLFSQTIL